MAIHDLTGLEHVQAIVDGRIKIPVHDALGIVFKEASAGELVIALTPKRDKHYNSVGTVHGLVISSLLDTVAGYAAATVLPPGQRDLTARLNIQFMKAGSAEAGVMRAIGKVTGMRNRLIRAMAEVHQCDQVIAAATGVFVVRDFDA